MRRGYRGNTAGDRVEKLVGRRIEAVFAVRIPDDDGIEVARQKLEELVVGLTIAAEFGPTFVPIEPVDNCVRMIEPTEGSVDVDGKRGQLIVQEIAGESG